MNKYNSLIADEDKLKCPYCKGANLVHPKLKNGCPDWSGLIFCPNCQGELGGSIAITLLIKEEDKEKQLSGGDGADFPTSYTFRRFFASRVDGVQLPALEPILECKS